MVRNYKRKADKVDVPNDIILRAIKKIKIERGSYRKTALEFGINVRTLTRYCKKVTNEQLIDPMIENSPPNFHFKKTRQVSLSSIIYIIC